MKPVGSESKSAMTAQKTVKLVTLQSYELAITAYKTIFSVSILPSLPFHLTARKQTKHEVTGAASERLFGRSAVGVMCLSSGCSACRKKVANVVSAIGFVCLTTVASP